MTSEYDAEEMRRAEERVAEEIRRGEEIEAAAERATVTRRVEFSNTFLYARVIDVDDPSKEGRVRVMLPWFRADPASLWPRGDHPASLKWLRPVVPVAEPRLSPPLPEVGSFVVVSLGGEDHEGFFLSLPR